VGIWAQANHAAPARSALPGGGDAARDGEEEVNVGAAVEHKEYFLDLRHGEGSQIIIIRTTHGGGGIGSERHGMWRTRYASERASEKDS
jgi:hypothetical protein